jgi:hypothetical protein
MRLHETDAGDWLEQDDSVTTADTPPMAFRQEHGAIAKPASNVASRRGEKPIGVRILVIAPKPAKTSRTAAVSLATNSARDASLHRRPPAEGPIVPLAARGQARRCSAV